MKRFFLSLSFAVASVVAMAQAETATHIVQRGETLESIAKDYNVDVDVLDRLNPNADGVVYVGMKLKVPVAAMPESAAENPSAGSAEAANAPQTAASASVPTDASAYAHAERRMKTSVTNHELNGERFLWGFSYLAESFDDVKASGHYGFNLDALSIGGSLFGASVTVSSFNFGLVPSGYTNDYITFGPNVSYEVVENIVVALPVQCVCWVSFEGTDTKTSWGWSLTPSAYLWINKVALTAGIVVNGAFSGGSKVCCGFTAGVRFGI